VDVLARTAANRRLLADVFDRLDDDQLAVRSLCEEWTVRDVLGHLVATTTGSIGGLFRGSGPGISGPSEALAMAVAGRPVALDDLAGPGVDELRRRLSGTS
jgi:hypothetical protein